MIQKRIPESELILNKDNSVYHLHLKTEHIADTVLLVGDQNRVAMVSEFFDNIEHQIKSREFFTHTGTYKGKRLTVMSSGIGTDNIDIVINELYAALNIDPETRQEKAEKRNINIIRLGTSGGLQEDIKVGDFVVSSFGLGLDGLIYFYNYKPNKKEEQLNNDFQLQLDWNKKLATPYFTESSLKLRSVFNEGVTWGITASGTGFYGPQGRFIHEQSTFNLQEELFKFKGSQDERITNFDMETSALFGLGRLFGFECITINVIIANRVSKQFHKNGKEAVLSLIKYVLEKVLVL